VVKSAVSTAAFRLSRKCCIAALLALLGAHSALAETKAASLTLATTSASWQPQALLFRKPTRYTLVPVTDAGPVTAGAPAGPVWRADSVGSASGWIHPLRITQPQHLHLRWQWRVASALTHTDERRRRGDDYAARVLVVFETSVIPTRTRALNYVWAAHEPVGAIFRNPYSSEVGMIVLRSGATEAHTWQLESRDVWADYVACFGHPPKELTAVALMVDTDDTDTRATAWFSEVTAIVHPAPVSSP
jgi:Protein of unknown function (DUF3047)